MHALRGVPHVLVRLARRVVPLVVLAWGAQRRQLVVDPRTRRGSDLRCIIVGGVERQ